MIVILDTNTIIQNPKMDSGIHNVLFNYLDKTDSYLLMPEVVYQELPVVYKRLLTESSCKFVNAYRKLSSLLITSPIDISLDIEKETTLFFSKVLTIYSNFNKDYRIAYQPGMLEEAVRRAILKIKPCSENKEEFRDTLLWLSVINTAEKQDEKNIIFITNNTTDFCDGNNNLHEHLQNDIATKKIKVLFFKTINDFVREYAEQIEGIDNTRVKELISEINLEKELPKIIEKYHSSIIERHFNRKYDWVGYIDYFDTNSEIRSYNIYEMYDDTYLLVVYLDTILNVDAEIEDSDFERRDIEDYHSRIHITNKDIELAITLKCILNSTFDVISYDVDEIDLG